MSLCGCHSFSWHILWRIYIFIIVALLLLSNSFASNPGAHICTIIPKNSKFTVVVVAGFMVKVVYFDYDVDFIDFDSHVALPSLFSVALALVLVAVQPNEHNLFELLLFLCDESCGRAQIFANEKYLFNGFCPRGASRRRPTPFVELSITFVLMRAAIFAFVAYVILFVWYFIFSAFIEISLLPSASLLGV